MAEGERQPGECWQPPLKVRQWGFMKLETQKRRLPLKRPCTKGVSSLASMRRKRSQEKHRYLQ